MSKKRKVIIDCDPGIDDSLALMLACASDELEILGVTITAGNVETRRGAQNALDILNLMGRNDIPVYLGAERPLKREPVFAYDTHGDNGIGNYKLPLSPKVWKKDALTFLKKTLEENEDVSIIALGPLTNIAELIKTYPEVREKIKDLTLMGGSFRSPGNCSPVAEFNFWFDPDAAKLVLDNLNKPISMIGLDVTRKALLTPNYNQLIKNFDNNISRAINGMTKFYDDFHWKQEGVLGCVINDPLAVAYFLRSELLEGKDYYVEVITEGPALGMSMVDENNITKNPPNVRVLTDVNSKNFFKFFMKKIFPEQSVTIDKILNNNIYGE